MQLPNTLKTPRGSVLLCIMTNVEQKYKLDLKEIEELVERAVHSTEKIRNNA